MSPRSTSGAIRANRRKEQTSESLRENRSFLRSDFSVLQKLRSIHPVKTAIYLHQYTGAPVRTCEYWLEKNRLPSEAVWALLQSELGLQFLVAGMSDAKPRWWTWLLKLGVTASAMRRRAADRRLIQETLEADRDLTEAIARSTALAVSDEEFHRPYLDALSSMARSSRRPVASEEGDR